MLSFPDFEQKQILFVKAERGLENNLKFHNDNVVYLKDGKVVNRVSCYRLLSIFIFGDLTLTSVLIKKALKYGVSIFLLKNNLETYATIGSKAEGNYLLRIKQYGIDERGALNLSKKIVQNKIRNQLFLLKESNKISKEKYKIQKQNLSNQIELVRTNQELLGVEGSFSKNFFNAYFDKIGWYKRMPQSKVDIYNLLLDMGYTFIFNYIDSLLMLFGFDTYKGFYHRLFFQRKSLVCDIVEPFRCVIEKQLLKSYNLKQISKKDFKFSGGKYYLKYKESSKYARIFLDAVIDRKKNIFLYINDFYKFIFKDGQGRKFPIFKMSH